jgi:hypothetical protein
VFYDKANEGAPYADDTSGPDKADDAVAPGATHVYRWAVPARAGPGPSDPSSIVWPYHSHVNSPADSNAGLIGAIVVSAAGQARADGRARDIDREYVVLFAVMDENDSLYRDANIARFAGRLANPADDGFVESNLMHAMNGRIWGNLDGLVMRRGEPGASTCPN